MSCGKEPVELQKVEHVPSGKPSPVLKVHGELVMGENDVRFVRLNLQSAQVLQNIHVRVAQKMHAITEHKTEWFVDQVGQGLSEEIECGLKMGADAESILFYVDYEFRGTKRQLSKRVRVNSSDRMKKELAAPERQGKRQLKLMPASKPPAK